MRNYKLNRFTTPYWREDFNVPGNQHTAQQGANNSKHIISIYPDAILNSVTPIRNQDSAIPQKTAFAYSAWSAQ
ncbi:MAG: hypothetical protein Q8S27_23315 [Hoeflea sp.]|nr:hypothetical protein [Hoeflea sp.]